MANTSVFTELLQALAAYSEKVDKAEVTDNDFLEFQDIKSQIIRGYHAKYFGGDEYTALNSIYHIVKDGFREVLGLDGDGGA